MARVYSASFSWTPTPSDGDFDIWQVVQAADAGEGGATRPQAMDLLGYVIGQTADVGNAQEEVLDLRLLWVHGTSGLSFGTSLTSRPLDNEDSASKAAASRGPTLLVGTGTQTLRVIERFPWNVRNAPLQRWYLDDTRRLRMAQSISGGLYGYCLRCDTTIADDLTLAGTVYWREK